LCDQFEASRRGLTLSEVRVPVDDVSKSDVRLDVCNLDSDTLTESRVRNDNDESPFDTSDPITLFADIFDLDIALVALLDGWTRRTLFTCRRGG
jgi:hypothetical protein